MPRTIRLFEYDRVFRGRYLSEVTAIIAERASGSRRWYAAAQEHASADYRVLEEEAARALFPNVNGRYDLPSFALKMEDRREHGTEQQTTDHTANEPCAHNT